MTDLRRFSREHLEGVLTRCAAEGWPSFPADPDRAMRVLTAPGVTTVVALEQEAVVGFAEVFSDGELQAFRVDLLSEDAAVPFYESFPHFRKPGFRRYPFHHSTMSDPARDPDLPVAPESSA